MQLAVRRARGIVVSMLIWSIPWAMLGLIVGLVLRFGTFGTLYISTEFPGGIIPATMVAGAITGAVNGLVFGTLLMLAERNRRISDMRAWRVGLWSALASAGTTYLSLEEPIFSAAAGILGFAGGVLALRLAARGAGSEPSGPA